MDKHSAPKDATLISNDNNTMLTREIAIRAELFLRMPEGVSSNDLHDIYRAPSARNALSDLRKVYNIGIVKLERRVTKTGKCYWTQQLENIAEAKKLADPIERSRERYGPPFVDNIEALVAVVQ